jgi:hypothetical protein
MIKQVHGEILKDVLEVLRYAQNDDWILNFVGKHHQADHARSFWKSVCLILSFSDHGGRNLNHKATKGTKITKLSLLGGELLAQHHNQHFTKHYPSA